MLSSLASGTKHIASHPSILRAGARAISFSSKPVGSLILPSPMTFFGFTAVPQKHAYVVERFGKFHRILDPGLRFVIPFIDNISYNVMLKETAIPVHEQYAFTRDNVSVHADGMLYVRVTDPHKAAYGCDDTEAAVTSLAMTSMRSAFGKLSLERTFEDRESLNNAVYHAVSEASGPWGVEVLRYEIVNIEPPSNIKEAMEAQVAAERKKRATILDSEAYRQSTINTAEAEKKALVLESEAEAKAILNKSEATAAGIAKIGESLSHEGGAAAVRMTLSEQYIKAMKETMGGSGQQTFFVGSDPTDVNSTLAKAAAIFTGVSGSSTSPESIASYASKTPPSGPTQK